MKIKKGDQIKMLSGKDKNKGGKILRVFPQAGKVVAEGLNLVKKHQRAKKQGEKGQVIEIPRAVAVAKVMLVCPACNKPARIGYRLNEAGKKVRICKKCKQEN